MSLVFVGKISTISIFSTIRLWEFLWVDPIGIHTIELYIYWTIIEYNIVIVISPQHSNPQKVFFSWRISDQHHTCDLLIIPFWQVHYPYQPDNLLIHHFMFASASVLPLWKKKGQATCHRSMESFVLYSSPPSFVLSQLLPDNLGIQYPRLCTS